MDLATTIYNRARSIEASTASSQQLSNVVFSFLASVIVNGHILLYLGGKFLSKEFSKLVNCFYRSKTIYIKLNQKAINLNIMLYKK